MTNTYVGEVELAFEPPKAGKRRVFTAKQKRQLLEEAERPGNSMSGVARRFGIAPSLLFHWKRQMEAGADKGERPKICVS